MKKDEYAEQCKTVSYLQLLKNQGKVIEFFSVENENNLSFKDKRIAMIQGAKAKKSGKLKGVSDLHIILKDKVLYIEMKRKRKILKSGNESKENLASDEQLEFIETVNKSDVCFAFVAYGFDIAKEIIDKNIKL